VGSALELPLTQGDFEQKYGTVGGEQVIKDCIGAMKGVQESSQMFGNPKTLRAQLIENPGLLATDAPPDEIYTHTVWMGQRIKNTSDKIVSGYQSVLEGLPGLPPADQVANLKAYLFDQSLGPIPLSDTMSKDVGVLIKKLAKFEEIMNEYNTKLQAFTSQSGDMMAAVNTQIGTIEAHIKDLEKTRDDAYKAWRDFTIAAVACSVGCALIGAILAPFTGGVSLLVGGVAAIATGVGLGIKAASCRAKYNETVKLISEEKVEMQKKIRLRNDLGDFDRSMALVGPSMSAFLTDLQTVMGIWTQLNADLIDISKIANEGNVGTLPFLVKAKSDAAVNAWKDVSASAKQFTVESLVDYTSVAFGDPLPEQAAA